MRSLIKPCWWPCWWAAIIPTTSLSCSAFSCRTTTSRIHVQQTRKSSTTLRLEALKNEKEACLQTGLLISSFSDGLYPNPEARNFLRRALVQRLVVEQQQKAESNVRESVLASPCNGPDMEALNALERSDKAVDTLERPVTTTDWRTTADPDDVSTILKEIAAEKKVEVRFLYIPTAMYALRADSTRSPGRQRQTARADGKKRRNDIEALLKQDLGKENVNILTCTLDFDDGSIKQPTGSSDASKFPLSGTHALTAWKPHFIYIQGGNTFWLYHCIEKGDWAPSLKDALVGDSAAVYCGSSAGAILMGDSMETASWKGWDDPSVVPGRETFQDWKNVPGLSLTEGRSFFPHHDDALWESTIQQKVENGFDDSKLICLRDEDVWCWDGGKKEAFLLTRKE